MQLYIEKKVFILMSKIIKHCKYARRSFFASGDYGYWNAFIKRIGMCFLFHFRYYFSFFVFFRFNYNVMKRKTTID